MLGIFRRRRFLRKKSLEIDPDDVLIDSSNVSHLDHDQFEGRLEKPISRRTLYFTLIVGVLVLFIFWGRAYQMQILNGGQYVEKSENNLLRPIPVFAGRGVIYDRSGVPLAWNSPSESAPDEKIDEDGDAILDVRNLYSDVDDKNSDHLKQAKVSGHDSVARREYATSTGLSHVLGYVRYPSKDSNGFYYREDFEGVDGAEQYFNDALSGDNGSRLVEVDARGKVISENVVRPAKQGQNVALSIDMKVQTALYENIKAIAESVGFTGGAGIIMDVHTGEIITITSYPEFSAQKMSDRTDVEYIRSALKDRKLLFLDRAVDGLYTPGSIMKPFMAMAALSENIIDPNTIIHTLGYISIPNPYDASKSTVFRDWKNLGSVDMRKAIAMSSDVYFYTIGGGYKDQKGLGIRLIDKYLQIYGFGQKIPDSFVTGKVGTIPTPEWKKETFDEDWYLGNTYHTSIGQYGFQITPIQAVRAISAIANGGSLVVPKIEKGSAVEIERKIDLSENHHKIVQEGMRMAVTQGTAMAVSVPYTKVAAKTGTAELGIAKDRVNSWITGFWPYEKPKYAFIVLMENGSVHNLIGASAVMRQQLDWMNMHAKEYFN